MKFCPKCDVRLKKVDSELACPKCGYTEGNTETKKTVLKAEQDPEFNVLEETEGNKTLSTIQIKCQKCGHNEAVWWMLQTRSADEPTTQFYRCTKCNFTWRNYA